MLLTLYSLFFLPPALAQEPGTTPVTVESRPAGHSHLRFGLGLDVAGLADPQLVGGVFNSGLIELDLPLLQLGVGPSADWVNLVDCSAADLACGRTNGVFPGIDGRVAVVLGPHGPGSHMGFALNANVHPTFLPDSVLTTVTLGIGGEMY